MYRCSHCKILIASDTIPMNCPGCGIGCGHDNCPTCGFVAVDEDGQPITGQVQANPDHPGYVPAPGAAAEKENPDSPLTEPGSPGLVDNALVQDTATGFQTENG